jgi:hypothetical protein
MQKGLILVLGVLLNSYLPGTAQTPATQVLLMQEGSAPLSTLVRAVPAQSPATTFVPPQGPRKPPAHLIVRLAAAYKYDLEVVDTSFVKESRVPVVQLWGGRLHLDAFESELNMGNALLGPSASGHPGVQVPREVVLYGISLRFRLGRDAQRGSRAEIWQCLARIVGSGRDGPGGDPESEVVP